MDANRLISFIERAGEQTRALDAFVEDQRAVAGAVRARDWQALEKSLERASSSADAVSAADIARSEAWTAFLYDCGQPLDASVFRASLALPVEYRSTLNDSYRMLRLSATRARIENEALSCFVGDAATTLRQTMEALFPERKGHIYCKTGAARRADIGAMILDTAF